MYKLFLYFDLGRINVINYTQEGFIAMQTSVQHEAEKCKIPVQLSIVDKKVTPQIFHLLDLVREQDIYALDF